MMKWRHVFVWLLLALWSELACLGGTQVKSVADLDSLKAQASRTKRLVLLLITSSDPSCWQCKKVSERFLADREFSEWAERSTVFGEIDIAAKGRVARDSMLATVYAAHAGPVPGLVLLHADGRRLAQAPHGNGSVAQSLADFQTIFAREIDGVMTPDITTKDASIAGGNNSPPKVAETRWNPPDAKPVQYSGLKLKNIAKRGQQRFALINDQTLMTGETAKVRSNGTRLRIKLVEIREDSVDVLVEGEQQPRLLKLKAE